MSDLHDETSRTGMTTVQTTVTRDQLTRAQARAEEWLTDRGAFNRSAVKDIMEMLAGGTRVDLLDSVGRVVR